MLRIPPVLDPMVTKSSSVLNAFGCQNTANSVRIQIHKVNLSTLSTYSLGKSSGASFIFGIHKGVLTDFSAHFAPISAPFGGINWGPLSH